MASLPTANNGRDTLPFSPRINVFGHPLQPVPLTPDGPTTGFFRNNTCDASQLDPGQHTLAGVMTPDFLAFSASRGNDLRGLFGQKQDCRWCLCVSRWKEALIASRTHPLGEKIVPKVILESTHESVLRTVGMADLERFAVGGNGDGPTGAATSSEGNGGAVERPGR